MESRKTFFCSFVALIFTLALFGTIILVATKPSSRSHQQIRVYNCDDGPDANWTTKPVPDTQNGSFVELKELTVNTSIWNMPYHQIKCRVKNQSKVSLNAQNKLVQLGEFLNRYGLLDSINSKLERIYSNYEQLPPKTFQYANVLFPLNQTLIVPVSQQMIHQAYVEIFKNLTFLENWVNEKFPEVKNVSLKNVPLPYEQISFDEEKALVMVFKGQQGLDQYLVLIENATVGNLRTLWNEKLNNLIVKVDQILKIENGLERFIGQVVGGILALDSNAALEVLKQLYDRAIVPFEKALLDIEYM